MPNSSGFEVSRRCSSATSEKLNDVRNSGITEGQVLTWEPLGLSAW